MAFLARIAFSLGNFLLTCPGREFVDIGENIQGEVGSDVLAHRGPLRAGCADCVPAGFGPGERSVLPKDDVPAMKPVAVPVLVAMCPGPLITAVLKVAGVLCAP